MSLQATPSQTFGPFFHIGLPTLTVALPPGAQAVTLAGRVLDGDGKPVADAYMETWQADLQGCYPGQPAQGLPPQSQFAGLGRTPTDAEGRFRIPTYRPGPVTAPGGGVQAPHILVSIGMRGLLKHLVTRVYLPGDDALLAADPVLQLVPAARRATLIARAANAETAPAAELHWDVHLQGPDETVFFDC